MHTDYYLRFDDEETMRSVLFEKVPTKFEPGETPEDEPVAVEWEDRQRFRNTDIIGLIVDQPGTYSEEGEEINPPTYVDGVHANIRMLDSEEDQVSIIESYTIETPNTPARVWA